MPLGPALIAINPAWITMDWLAKQKVPSRLPRFAPAPEVAGVLLVSGSATDDGEAADETFFRSDTAGCCLTQLERLRFFSTIHRERKKWWTYIHWEKLGGAVVGSEEEPGSGPVDENESGGAKAAVLPPPPPRIIVGTRSFRTGTGVLPIPGRAMLGARSGGS